MGIPWAWLLQLRLPFVCILDLQRRSATKLGRLKALISHVRQGKKGAALYGPFLLGKLLASGEDALTAERLPLAPSEPPGGQDEA